MKDFSQMFNIDNFVRNFYLKQILSMTHGMNSEKTAEEINMLFRDKIMSIVTENMLIEV